MLVYRDQISARQVYVILFAALLSPAVRALPTWTAGTAGVGAWLTGLFAFPVLLIMGWALFSLFRGAGADHGLAEIFQDTLGTVVGKLLTIIYMVWAMFLLCLELRLYGERMLAANSGNVSLPPLLIILLAMVLWLCRKKLAAFARAAEIFYLILAVALGLVLAFSVADLRPENVLPVWTGDIPSVAAATTVPLGVVGVGIFAAFLGGRVKRREGDRRRGLGWLAAGCSVLAFLQFGVLAQMGPLLAARLEYPFFEVARGVGIDGAFQRVESVVVALWLLSDLALLGLLIFALRAMTASVFGKQWEKWAPPISVILAFLGAVFLLPDGFAAENLASGAALLGNLLLGFAVPLLVLVVQKIKGPGKGVHI
ncbi:MAG: spore gernimation protein [Clostridia bacterium]|nr:spore gernimation protein [Clostridia bacterium]